MSVVFPSEYYKPVIAQELTGMPNPQMKLSIHSQLFPLSIFQPVHKKVEMIVSVYTLKKRRV